VDERPQNGLGACKRCRADLAFFHSWREPSLVVKCPGCGLPVPDHPALARGAAGPKPGGVPHIGPLYQE
jgi:hypothetical protein